MSDKLLRAWWACDLAELPRANGTGWGAYYGETRVTVDKRKYREIGLLNKKIIGIALATLLVAGCAAPPKFSWVKEGASSHQRDTALSECSYQIKLGKTAAAQQPELLQLCMQGKGFRYKRVA